MKPVNVKMIYTLKRAVNDKLYSRKTLYHSPLLDDDLADYIEKDLLDLDIKISFINTPLLGVLSG